MTGSPLRIGTRTSLLALWQAARVRDRLEAAGVRVTLVEITTTGDRIQDRALATIGDTALFTRQLDDALLEDRIDLAVHSLKDLPSRLRDGIALAAVSEREDPRDALVGRGPVRWDRIPRGAVIATCSVRRRAQLLWRRPDLQVVDIRGNVDTRLAKLDGQEDWHATVLAAAGLVRLGRDDRIGERFDPAVMLPAPGQGALGITTRVGDRSTAERASAAIHHPASAAAVLAERALLGGLDGGCQAPIGALGIVSGDRVHLRARVLSTDGVHCLEGEAEHESTDPASAEALGRELAGRLLDRGAAAILADSRVPAGEARP